MSIRSRLASIFRKRASAPGNWWPFTGMGSHSLASGHVTDDSAKSISTYFACLRNLSEDVAKLPLILYRREGDGKARATDHPIFKLLRTSPNREMTSITFRETLTWQAASWGRGVAEIERNGRGEPIALWPIHASRVTVKRMNGNVVYVVRNDDGTATGLPAADVLHVHPVGDNGLDGWSVLKYGAESLGLAIAAQDFGAAYFGNGSTSNVALSHPEQLSATAKNNLRESWAKVHEGARNAFKPFILEEGMKVEKMTIPPNEAQFLELRQFQVEEICRWFRMPPHKVQHLLRATFSNIEHQGQEYVTDCLMPWMVRWEQEIFRKLLSPQEQETYFAEHLTVALLRGDQAARGEFYKKLFDMGAITPNEIRALENMNPFDGGDVHLIPVNNLAPLGPKPPTAPVLPAPTPTEGKGAKGLIEAFEPALADAARRIAEIESKFLRRCIAKSVGAEKLAEFYGHVEADIAEAFTPSLRAAGAAAPTFGLTPPATWATDAVKGIAAAWIASTPFPAVLLAMSDDTAATQYPSDRAGDAITIATAWIADSLGKETNHEHP